MILFFPGFIVGAGPCIRIDDQNIGARFRPGNGLQLGDKFILRGNSCDFSSPGKIVSKYNNHNLCFRLINLNSFIQCHLYCIFNRVNHRIFAGDSLTCNIKSSAVIHRSSDNRKAQRDVHAFHAGHGPYFIIP